MDDAEIHYAKSKHNSDARNPYKFKYDECIYWQQIFITYLTSKNSVNPSASISLYYVIHTEPCPIVALEKSPSDEIIYNASYTGRAFETDDKKVHRVLDELTLGTGGADWIKTYRRRHDGRAAWIVLCENYDGPAEGDKRVTVSRSNIDQAFYKNESTLSFERYTTCLKYVFDTLRQYNKPRSGLEEFEILLKHINTNNTQNTACIQICRHIYSANSNDAATDISTHIAQIFPDSQPGSHARCGLGHTNIHRHNVAKAQTRNGKKLFNGVDITHTERYFPLRNGRHSYLKDRISSTILPNVRIKRKL